MCSSFRHGHTLIPPQHIRPHRGTPLGLLPCPYHCPECADGTGKGAGPQRYPGGCLSDPCPWLRTPCLSLLLFVSRCGGFSSGATHRWHASPSPDEPGSQCTAATGGQACSVTTQNSPRGFLTHSSACGWNFLFLTWRSSLSLNHTLSFDLRPLVPQWQLPPPSMLQ